MSHIDKRQTERWPLCEGEKCTVVRWRGSRSKINESQGERRQNSLKHANSKGGGR